MCHVVSNVSKAWVSSCELRDELESPLVVTPFLCSIEARRFSLEDPEPTLSSLRHECESYHCSASWGIGVWCEGRGGVWVWVLVLVVVVVVVVVVVQTR